MEFRLFVLINFISLLMAQDMPPYVWTIDEVCQMSFGRDYFALRSSIILDSSNPYLCSGVSCYSQSMPTFSQTVTAISPNGAICGPSQVCVYGSCTSFPLAPKIMLFDELIMNMTCDAYLQRGNQSYARTFCLKTDISPITTMLRCPIACKKYQSFPCDDSFVYCQGLGGICNSTFPGTNRLVQDICPFSCNKCPDSNFNPCSANPCTGGKRCVKVGTFNFFCV